MTRYSKFHIIIVFITLMISVLKGQDTNILPSDSPILLDEWNNHRSSLSRKTEIIPYRIVPSDNPLYGCWSELEVIWPEYLSYEIQERLTITIVNQELHHDIPDYVEINDNDGTSKHYYMMKLPLNHWWRD